MTEDNGDPFRHPEPPTDYTAINRSAVIPAVQERLNCSPGRAIGIINAAVDSGDVRHIFFCFEEDEWIHSDPKGEHHTYLSVEDFWDWFARQNYRPSKSENMRPNKRASAQGAAAKLWANGSPPATISDKMVCAAVQRELGDLKISHNTILRAVRRK